MQVLRKYRGLATARTKKRATRCRQSELKKALTNDLKSRESHRATEHVTRKLGAGTGTSEGCHLQNHSLSQSVENSWEPDVTPRNY